MDKIKLEKATLVSVVVLAILGVGYALVSKSKTARSPDCISEEMMTIPDLAGVRVEVVYTNCDTLLKDEAVKINFSRAAVKGDFWFARGRSRRTLVFWYDPSGRAYPDMPLPSVTNPAPSTILISIPEVSSVKYKDQKWENMTINYFIGKVY